MQGNKFDWLAVGISTSKIINIACKHYQIIQESFAVEIDTDFYYPLISFYGRESSFRCR